MLRTLRKNFYLCTRILPVISYKRSNKVFRIKMLWNHFHIMKQNLLYYFWTLNSLHGVSKSPLPFHLYSLFILTTPAGIFSLIWSYMASICLTVMKSSARWATRWTGHGLFWSVFPVFHHNGSLFFQKEFITNLYGRTKTLTDSSKGLYSTFEETILIYFWAIFDTVLLLSF